MSKLAEQAERYDGEIFFLFSSLVYDLMAYTYQPPAFTEMVAYMKEVAKVRLRFLILPSPLLQELQLRTLI
jgi:hypothetical protein